MDGMSYLFRAARKRGVLMISYKGLNEDGEASYKITLPAEESFVGTETKIRSRLATLVVEESLAERKVYGNGSSSGVNGGTSDQEFSGGKPYDERDALFDKQKS